mgnify:CR=1 FL=1
MFYSLFNYTKLFLWSIIFYSNYKIYNECNKDLLRIVLYNVQNTNILAIKCIQKAIPYLRISKTNKEIIDILNRVYEQNIYHSDKDTLKIYKKDFNEIFSKKYEIISSISSGSIGQVYKIKDIHSDKFYAMKVIHPNVKYHIKFITTMIWLFTLQNYMFFELDQFINNFISETDFKNEVLNMKQFYEYYKDNNNIIIPQVYKWSKNIIIMDFIEGKIITELSMYEQSKYLSLSFLFNNNNKYILNFNHGDMHLGNFKKYKENKIVIYDFGYCFKVNDDKIVEIFNDFYGYLFEVTSKDEFKVCLYYFIYYHTGETTYEKYENDLNDTFLKTEITEVDDLVERSYNFFIKNNIIMKVEYLNLLSSMYFAAGLWDFNFTDLLSFCQTYDIFHEYQKKLKKQIVYRKEEKIEFYDKNLYEDLKNLM